MIQSIINLIFVASFLLCSCQPRRIVSTPEKNREVKPSLGEFQKMEYGKEVLFSKTRYQISAQAKVPAINGPFPDNLSEICSGQAEMQVFYPTYRIKFEDLKVKCSYFNINSSRILPWQPQPVDSKVYTEENFMLIQKSNALVLDDKSSTFPIQYQPAIPYFMPQIITDKSALLKVDRNYDSTISYNKDGNNFSSSGKINYKVLSANNTFESPNEGFVFDEVVIWERTINGFEDLPLAVSLAQPVVAYKKWKWWVNTTPSAIVRMRITAPAKIFVSSTVLSSSLTFLFGDITLDLKMLKHEEYDPQSEAQEEAE